MFTHRRSQGATNPLSRTEEGTRAVIPGRRMRARDDGGWLFRRSLKAEKTEPSALNSDQNSNLSDPVSQG